MSDRTKIEWAEPANATGKNTGPFEYPSLDDNGATYATLELHSGRALITAVAQTGDVVLIPLTPVQAREMSRGLDLIADTVDAVAEALTNNVPYSVTADNSYPEARR